MDQPRFEQQRKLSRNLRNAEQHSGVWVRRFLSHYDWCVSQTYTALDEMIDDAFLEVRGRGDEKLVDPEISTLVDFSVLTNVLVAENPSMREYSLPLLAKLESLASEFLEFTEMGVLGDAITARIGKLCREVKGRAEGSIELTGEPRENGHVILIEDRHICLSPKRYATFADLVCARHTSCNRGYETVPKARISHIRRQIDDAMHWHLSKVLIGNGRRAKSDLASISRYRLNMDTSAIRVSEDFDTLVADGVISELKYRAIVSVLQT